MAGARTVPEPSVSGFAALRGAFDPALIEGIAAAAAHRGHPHVWRDDGVALIAFEGRRRAPLFVSQDLVVALDARIDNRTAVVSALGADAPPPGATDAELIARVWRRWNANGLRRVIGDFAGAIYDRRSRVLSVVRDPLGVRPALLARSAGRLLAASDLPMLLADASLDRTPDEEWVAAFLVAGAGFRRAAGYRDTWRLEPGAAANASDGGWVERPWWTWRYRRVRERDDAAYAERFRELFDEAVRTRIAGARRVGVSLSGGLDSTSVAASVRETVAPDQLAAGFAIGFESAEGDERALQRLVAARLGLPLRWVAIEAGPFDADPIRTIERLGVPPLSPNWFHPEAVARAAAADGIDVALDGIDGDSLLQGSPEVLSDLMVRGRWRTWRREAEALRRVQGVGRRTALRRYSVKPLVPNAALTVWRRAQGRRDVPAFVAPDLARRYRLESLLTHDSWWPGRTFAVREMGAVSPVLLPMTMELLDSIWSRRGIEIAHPFLDRRVVEFCLGLPWTQKLRGGFTKSVLRNAMSDRLPTDITARAAKADLSAPFINSVLGQERTFVLEGLSLAASNGTTWWSSEGLRRLGESFADGEDPFEAYRVAILAHWYRWTISSGSHPSAPRKETRSTAYH